MQAQAAWSRALSEYDLVLAAQAGRERDQFVEAFRHRIASVARLYKGVPSVSRTELIQEGVVGLLRALERFDPEIGTPFWAYAAWWVRQAMQQLVSELSGPVVLSDRAARQVARIRDAQRQLFQRRGREPTARELVAATGLNIHQIDSLIAAHRQPRSLQQPAPPDGDGMESLGESIPDPRQQQAYDRIPDQLAAVHLPRLLAELSERERGILEARYGLGGRVQTLREVGARLSISAERVRQIEVDALTKLQRWALARAAKGSAPRPERPHPARASTARASQFRSSPPRRGPAESAYTRDTPGLSGLS